jgi:hypothetical protein
VRRLRVAAIAAAVLVMFGLVNPATAAASDDCMRMHSFGSQQRLADAGGTVVQEWTVTDVRKSSDPAPGYPLVGQLWEATVAVQAISGAVTPIIPNFQARTAGGSYPALWQTGESSGHFGSDHRARTKGKWQGVFRCHRRRPPHAHLHRRWRAAVDVV